MKKISKMLLKSYMILILIFTFSGIVIFITVEAYIKRSSADDLYAIDSFLQYETKEFKEKLESGRKINDIIDSALDEAPKILGSSIIFELNGQILSKSYSENELKQVENEDYYDIVKECGYYNLQYLKRKIKLLLYFMIFFIKIHFSPLNSLLNYIIEKFYLLLINCWNTNFPSSSINIYALYS